MTEWIEARVSELEIAALSLPPYLIPFKVRHLFEDRGIKYGQMRGRLIFDPLDAIPLLPCETWFDVRTLEHVIRQGNPPDPSLPNAMIAAAI